MRGLRKYGLGAAVLGIGAALWLTGRGLPGSDPAPANPAASGKRTVAVKAAAPDGRAGACDAAARGEDGRALDSDLLWPGEQERLLEQIETARMGLLAAAHQAADPSPSRPVAAAPRTAAPPLASLAAAGAGLAGAVLALGLRRRRTHRRGSNGDAGTVPEPRDLPPVAIAAGDPEPQVEQEAREPLEPNPQPEPCTVRPAAAASESGFAGLKAQGAEPLAAAPMAVAPVAPAEPSLEVRLRTLEETILTMLQVMEESCAATAAAANAAEATPSVATSAAATQAAATQAAATPAMATPAVSSPSSRTARTASAAPAAGSKPAPDREDRPGRAHAAMADGRSLHSVRRAVLRLAEEGWEGERIARSLKLGASDVALILRSTGGKKVSPARASSASAGTDRLVEFYRRPPLRREGPG